MSAAVSRYLKSYRELMGLFGCPNDYFIKSMMGYNWEILYEGDIWFLSYWKNNGDGKNGESGKTGAVIVRAADAPMVYRTKDYALVVAIDCVKIGFLMETRLTGTDLDNLDDLVDL